jgi:hypothetical protein
MAAVPLLAVACCEFSTSPRSQIEFRLGIPTMPLWVQPDAMPDGLVDTYELLVCQALHLLEVVVHIVVEVARTSDIAQIDLELRDPASMRGFEGVVDLRGLLREDRDVDSGGRREDIHADVVAS